MLKFFQLEKVIEAEMQAKQVPGLALALVQGQEVVYARGFGVTSVEDAGLAVTPHTLFRIGSITKPLTGTAILRLVEAGKLDLERPIQHYIEWFTLPDTQAASKITLRMLLSHRSGLPPAADHFGRHDPEGLEIYIRESVTQMKLVAPPDTIMVYSNPGLSLAGYVAEVVARKSYAELMEEFVFQPLQMERTTFDPMVAMTYPLAQAHTLNQDGKLCTQHHFADNVADYPAGFVFSNVLELANFALMQLNMGAFQGQQLLSPDSIQLMHRQHASLHTIHETGYGLTFFQEEYKGTRLVWHDGGISTFVATLTLVPAEKLAVIMLMNRPGLEYSRIARGILDEVLELPEKESMPEIVVPDRALWPGFVGDYVGRWGGLATIQTREDALILDLNGEVRPLQAVREDLYLAMPQDTSEEPLSVGFVLAEEGSAPYVYLDTFVFDRDDRLAQVVPEPELWQKYAGTYCLAEDNTLRVTVKAEHLVIHSSVHRDEVVCRPLGRTRFSSKWGVFDFHLAEDGTANVLELGELQKFLRVPETDL